jgi:hypothetical protein
MDMQQALNALQIFGDKCVGAGLFKSVADVLTYKQAVEQVVSVINQQQQKIDELTQKQSL